MGYITHSGWNPEKHEWHNCELASSHGWGLKKCAQIDAWDSIFKTWAWRLCWRSSLHMIDRQRGVDQIECAVKAVNDKALRLLASLLTAHSIWSNPSLPVYHVQTAPSTQPSSSKSWKCCLKHSIWAHFFKPQPWLEASSQLCHSCFSGFHPEWWYIPCK